MNEIGVFLDEKNEISSFTEAKSINIFDKEENSWKIKKEILIERRSNGRVIKEIRKEYSNLVNQMDDCKIIIVTKAIGIPYSIFYSEDFSVWELQGNPLNFLDYVIEKEKQEDERKENKEEIAKKLGEGYYFIDLMELELLNPEMSSKKAIIPYLKEEDVKKIEIHCCHVPPWLIKEEDGGSIELDIQEMKRNDFNVTIKKKN